MTFGVAVMTSALVAGSAQMMVPLSDCDAGVCPPGGPPVGAALAPEICSFNLAAIFSASAFCR